MEGDLQRKLGASLRSARQEHQLSQIVFSEWLGFHRTYVGALERGERNPTLRTVERLAAGLGVDALDLLRGPEEGDVVQPARKAPPAGVMSLAGTTEPAEPRAKPAKPSTRRRTV